MSMQPLECPAIHVSLLAGADPGLYRWVEIGAEEEGVPTRQVPGEAGDLALLAYQAAQSSRLSIGVGISAQAVVLHEQHMPAGQPVLSFAFSGNAPFLCRLMGANAARMVVHRPLHIDLVDAPPPADRPPAVNRTPAAVQLPAHSQLQRVEAEIDPAQLARIVTIVVHKLLERGI